MKKNRLFNRRILKLKSLTQREHGLKISIIAPLELKHNLDLNGDLKKVAQRIAKAKKKGASIIWMIGGHVIRSGVQRYIIDLMERGYISCLAMNGAGIIHDYELALIGATTESVAKYIKEGQFGLWKETGEINNIINRSYKQGLGLGEGVGKAIYEGNFPYKEFSLLAAGYRLKVLVTVHVGIGYDIIHEHPNCDGAAMGATSYRDFLMFAKVISNLEKGIIMNFGSAVMAPEVFLKALSMARNVAHQRRKQIKHFTSVVCDLYNLPPKFSKEPGKHNPGYYFRPWKTMLVRTVADGGSAFYIKGCHADVIPALWKEINESS
ncbi:MAG: hypothetical protein NTW18_00740 [Candidatus Omnitrophica bacterium]|nr:hypothetical protein [Candidatus Omnitrophota bacterium]